MIYTPSVQTTFLPKNNQLDFHVRGGVRSTKGRVFGSKPNGPGPEFDPLVYFDASLVKDNQAPQVKENLIK